MKKLEKIRKKLQKIRKNYLPVGTVFSKISINIIPSSS
jgi:hypothetical protein